ncbi:PcbC domain-containing protein [Histoplasma capsulatum G186AR]|uniref:PcbC domain-containing protein n=1 Tax=Ajellomyces capsulatus TaxID=5037 RepID=A0A8H7Z297_AJECA|nr:PcbC domain-containing protein [Histoplasma capsulatum]QSS71771.1 PcbC domain-containing protein [Histoplasma capsulatum G186AR]
MFVDEEANPPASLSSSSATASSNIPELPNSPDPKAGLYIRSRTGQVVKVNIPKDCLAFQTGEALELITRGRFRAVPHFVRGVRRARGKIARNTLVREGKSFADFAREVVERNH